MRIVLGRMLGAAAIAATLATSAAAQTESVIYSLPIGSTPSAPLLRDNTARGVFYGTSFAGGDAAGDGAVFKLRGRGDRWKGSTIYEFANKPDGAQPAGSLVEDDSGILYGTTLMGGVFEAGTVFSLSPAGETVLHDFGNDEGSVLPSSDLVLDKTTGTLYGTTQSGGLCGTVYQLAQSAGVWTLTTLYAFKGGSDGCGTPAALHMDDSGNLFGVTLQGGPSNAGTVFELTKLGGWSEGVLYAFTGHGDGANPSDMDLDLKYGRLYGVAESGGASGNGTVFALRQHNGVWSESTLYSFAGASDGRTPLGIKLAAGSAKTLYGTTRYGGTSDMGTVFTLAQRGSSWQETVFHSFAGKPDDGAEPRARPIEDPKTGYLYGTTLVGGRKDSGVVYQLIP